MSDGIGMVYGDVVNTAHEIRGIADTIETVKNICDGVVVALGVASAVPGAAAVTGPVIGIYESVAPTIGEVIDLCQLVDDYLQRAAQMMETLDQDGATLFNNIDVGSIQGFAQSL